MTAGTEVVRPLAPRKIPGPFPVNARFPVPVDVSVTFPAEAVAFCEIDELPVVKP